MLKFKTQPIKIDHDNKIVYMTEQQVADNKYQLVKDKPCGYKTKQDGYTVNMVLHRDKYILSYYILMDILWQAIRGLQIMYYTHCNADEIKAITARAYHIHQLLIPDAAKSVMPPQVNLSDILADREGLTLLKEVIAMPDADREALVQQDREEWLKAIPGADKILIEGEEITVNELAFFICTGCRFLLYDVTTTTRVGRESILFPEIVYGMFFSGILDGKSEDDAIDFTANNVVGMTKELVKIAVNKMTV